MYHRCPLNAEFRSRTEAPGRAAFDSSTVVISPRAHLHSLAYCLAARQHRRDPPLESSPGRRSGPVQMCPSCVPHAAHGGPCVVTSSRTWSAASFAAASFAQRCTSEPNHHTTNFNQGLLLVHVTSPVSCWPQQLPAPALSLVSTSTCLSGPGSQQVVCTCWTVHAQWPNSTKCPQPRHPACTVPAYSMATGHRGALMSSNICSLPRTVA